MKRYHARWVCPVSSAPLKNGTLVEEDGRIAYIGPRAAAPAGEDIELGDAIVIPGLVNTHCHLELTAMRGFLDGLGFREWIVRLTRARRAVLTPEMLLDAARLGVDEGLLHGITTFADTGDTGTGFDAMLERGARGICYREVFGPDPAQCEAAISELQLRVAEMGTRATNLVRVGVSPHAPYTVSDPLYRATVALARDQSLPIAVHIAESALETDLVVRGEGEFAGALKARGIAVAPRATSPIALMEDVGVLGLHALLIHCVRVSEEDVAKIASHDCAVAHCPASNARLGHGIAPLARFLRAGIRTGLGTDSVASNDRMDLLDEARLASLFANANDATHDAVSATMVLDLATRGGARALGIDNETGSLDVGKSADFAAFPCPPHRAPVHDPIAALVLAMPGTRASFVAVAGRALVRRGALVQHDEGLAQRVQDTADRLQDWLAASLVGAESLP